MADESATEIEMIVDSVRVHMRTGRHVLVLRESGRGRLLMIWVGVNEANAIAMKLQGAGWSWRSSGRRCQTSQPIKGRMKKQ